jgi:hypothetical protein
MKLNTNIRPEKDTVKKAWQYKFLAYGVVKADDDIELAHNAGYIKNLIEQYKNKK